VCCSQATIGLEVAGLVCEMRGCCAAESDGCAAMTQAGEQNIAERQLSCCRQWGIIVCVGRQMGLLGLYTTLPLPVAGCSTGSAVTHYTNSTSAPSWHVRLQAVGCGARLCQDILKQHTLQAGILSFCVCLRVWIALRLHLQQRPLNGIEAIVCALYQQCVFDSALVPQRSCNISCVWWCAAPSLS
jgi:hypothetical protein